MHLGFHIYDTGFQSPNVNASTPLVYSTTLVLLVLVLLLNLGAVILRNRLRKKFRDGSLRMSPDVLPSAHDLPPPAGADADDGARGRPLPALVRPDPRPEGRLAVASRPAR